MDETAKNEWQRIRSVFEDVLLKPAEERKVYAEKLCGNDKILWNEVISLLDWHESSESFLETPAVVQVTSSNQLSDQLVAGQRLLHYEIRKLIGKGGMGEVYLARDTKLDRNVAVKILRTDLSPHVLGSERLLREARAVALLEHPNICHIYEISEVDGFNFIVMQYVVGTTLDEILSGRGIDVDSALDLGIQIAEGLAEAHSQGIIHRDIKPANIIVSEKGPAKILDFGLAKFIEAETGAEAMNRMESAGGVMGTIPYMSPEQILGGPVDARTDVFSFGALLFEMLSGSSAFSRGSNSETVSAILNEEPDILLVPPSVRPVLQRCLAKNRSDRYPSASELSDALVKVRRVGPVRNPRRASTTGPNRIFAATELTDLRTAPFEIPAPEGDALFDPRRTPKEPVIGRSTSGLRDRSRVVLAGILGGLVLTTAIFGYLYSTAISKETLPENKSAATVPLRFYWELSNSAKRQFVRSRVTHIQNLIGGDQRAIDDRSLEGIVEEVDRYVGRRDSFSQEPFNEGLRFIYGRASQYVAFVSSEFEKANVPAAIGIYQAMLESEYRDCLVSDTGPVGLFQFTRRTAALYDLTHNDLCKVDKQSRAAAHYMSDLLTEFGRENSSWTLSLLSFQQGADGTREQLRQLGELGLTERNYWAITENRGRLEPYLESSDNYIRKFFAAAIIGENPETFGLVTPPLSTLKIQPAARISILNGLIAIPGGTFQMGRNDGNENEIPAHEETVKPFNMDKTEVTNAEYHEFMKETGYKPASATKFLSHWKDDRPVAGEESMPVRYVNLEDVNAFVEWRSKRDGVDYRLPTEQEWEFAARNGPRGNLFPWGNQFDPNCAFIDQEKDSPVAVRTRSCADEWGVVDLVGNVAEWTSSTAWLYPESKGSVQLPMKEPRYMVRGGAARYKSSGEGAVTSTWRVDVSALTRHASLGFRLVTSQ